MLRTYEFCAEKPIQFDDERTVGELIQYAFDDYGIANSFNWRGMEWAIIELIAENMKKKYQSLEITRIYNDYEDGTTFVDYRYYVPNPKVLEDI